MEKRIDQYGFTVSYRANSADEEVLKHSFTKDVFLSNMAGYKVKEGDTIIDVGAHIGTLSLLCSYHNKTGNIYAIEPSLDSCELLVQNISNNNLTNVYPFPLALSDKKGQTKLYHSVETGNWGHSITKAFSEKAELVETETLENFMSDNGIEQCDFIKFNCEGSEFPILLNASSETYSKFKSMLVLYHMDLTEHYHINELVQKFKGEGFYTEKRFVHQQGQRGWLIAVRASTSKRIVLYINYLIRSAFSLAKRLNKKMLGRK